MQEACAELAVMHIGGQPRDSPGIRQMPPCLILLQACKPGVKALRQLSCPASSANLCCQNYLGPGPTEQGIANFQTWRAGLLDERFTTHQHMGGSTLRERAIYGLSRYQ